MTSQRFFLGFIIVTCGKLLREESHLTREKCYFLFFFPLFTLSVHNHLWSFRDDQWLF